MYWITIKVSLVICCWWLLWTEKLTDPDSGLFEFAPDYYPFKKNRKLQLLLRCAPCLSGWTSFLVVTAFSLYKVTILGLIEWQDLFMPIAAFCCSPIVCILIYNITFAKNK